MPRKPFTKSKKKKPDAVKKTVKEPALMKKESASSATVKNVMNSWKRRELKQKEQMRTLGDRVFDELAKLGVTRLLVEFNGSGDDGDLAVVKTEMADGKKAPVFDYEHPLYFEIEHLVCAHLTLDHSGWEQEVGSFGSYELEVIHRQTKEKEFTSRDEDEEYRETIAALSGPVFEELAKLGVTRLLAKFGGSGDPYELTAVETEATENGKALLFDGERSLYNRIEEIVHAYLNLDHPDGVGDDSFGSYEFDVPRRQTKAKEFTLNNQG